MSDSTLIDFDAPYAHLVRDGRGMIVSRWFFEKDLAVKKGIRKPFDKDFDTYVEEAATEWLRYVLAWTATPVSLLRYERFLATPHASFSNVIRQLEGVEIPKNVLHHADEARSKQRLSEAVGKTFKHSTFARRGVAGDWQNHFSPKNLGCFRSIAKDAMAICGYAF